MLRANDIRGMYAIIATPAKPNADRLDAENTVDLVQTEKLVNNLIRDGSTGLIILGTTGECATLSEPDYRTYVGSVLETVNRRIPTVVGATALGGHEIARRLKFVREQGADATLLGLPMWQPVTTKMAVDFYAAVSEMFPDLAIMVYPNARAFRYSFSADFWAAVATAAPTVTSAKYSNVKGLKELIAATKGRINFVPNEMAVHEFHALSPSTTTACWATASGMNPTPAVALMKALEAKNQEAIDTLVTAIGWANEPIVPMVKNPELFAQYNIQMEKTRINAAGYSNCGPARPPYQDFPEEYAAAARQCGERWAQICGAYAGNFTFRERPWEIAGSKIA
ncbi:MAG: dihydrodipicolinate synthase family protein [Silvibacterium sp.]|nr:dihydrodipicolinate synthase family protein [Silvibacterium sp.]